MSGGQESSWDGETPAWLISLLLHMVMLVGISVLGYQLPGRQLFLTLMTQPKDLEELPEEFHFSDSVTVDVGAGSAASLDMADSLAPDEAELTEIVQPTELPAFEVGTLQFSQELELATSPLTDPDHVVKGIAGIGMTGAAGAIDRITHEILLSLEQRETLVVWLFDSSGSLLRQRQEIAARFRHIYQELGLIREADQRQGKYSPLQSAVVAFGSQTRWLVEKPTDDVERLQAAVEHLELDPDGIENVFTAVYQAADRFRKLRVGGNKKNVMLVVVTDEVGDDQFQMADRTVELCRKFSIPVYVIGVPAAFGQSIVALKYVDPDPGYDQTPRRAEVNQGPETPRPERLRLPFAGSTDEVTIDSGFGPYALTRLCYESNGIYFAIHPNRAKTRYVSWQETMPYASHMIAFFDEHDMYPYRPQYVSLAEYDRSVQQNAARMAVVAAAQLTTTRMDAPRRQFVKTDDAEFARALTEAQKAAARLEPQLNTLYDILQKGEKARLHEPLLRWQAAYDLAMGQTLAVLVRTRAYNEMLALAKRGLAAEKPGSNTWTLAPADEITVGSRLAQLGEKARDYLGRVVSEHPATPWAFLAEQELKTPLGWQWRESFTPIRPPRQEPGAGNDGGVPSDDRPRMIPDGPPVRPIPRL